MNIVRSTLVLVPCMLLIACGDSDSSDKKKDSGMQPVTMADSSMPDTPMNGLSDEYSFEACPEAVAPDMIESFDLLPDCGEICGGGKCVPNEMAGEQATSILPACADMVSTCIPRGIAETSGSFKFQSCASLLDPTMEGACVPACFVPSDQRALVEQGSCAAGELCAPCVSPLDSQPTGACDLLVCGGGMTGDDAGAEDGG